MNTQMRNDSDGNLTPPPRVEDYAGDDVPPPPTEPAVGKPQQPRSTLPSTTSGASEYDPYEQQQQRRQQPTISSEAINSVAMEEKVKNVIKGMMTSQPPFQPGSTPNHIAHRFMVSTVVVVMSWLFMWLLNCLIKTLEFLRLEIMFPFWSW